MYNSLYFTAAHKSNDFYSAHTKQLGAVIIRAGQKAISFFIY
jgi:hypothetical protein